MIRFNDTKTFFEAFRNKNVTSSSSCYEFEFYVCILKLLHVREKTSTIQIIYLCIDEQFFVEWISENVHCFFSCIDVTYPNLFL